MDYDYQAWKLKKIEISNLEYTFAILGRQEVI